jgi:hypothetical protein
MGNHGKTIGKTMGKPWENEDFMGFVWEFFGIHMV